MNFSTNLSRNCVIGSFVLLLSACSANNLNPYAKRIEIVSEAPDRDNCEYYGEVYGSQGNWFTGGFTSNENLTIGARNELRNAAMELGADIVFLQESKATNGFDSSGTTNVTVVGKAFRCKL